MMKTNRFILIALLTAVVAIGISGGVARAAVTNFSTDVNTSIDDGLAWLASVGAFNNPSSAGEAAGLCMLSLLEKRQGADQDAVTQGYTGASVAEKIMLDNVAAYVIARSLPAGFRAYRDGGDLMALSVYLRTGGPNQAGALNSINAIFDRIKVSQNALGYWHYSGPGGHDSSTTQLVVAGLASCRSVYSDSNPAYSDPVRLAELDALTALCRSAYNSIGAQAPILIPGELGHGYTRGSTDSMQQTSSGLWIQLVGGADANDPGVQAYLKWLYARYEYDNNFNATGGWNNSYYYYLWSSAKAYTFIEDSGVPTNPGNLSVSDIGTLPPGDAPALAGRLVHLDPATVTRVPLHGLEGAGYYADPNETKRWYFDYSYLIMSKQSLPVGGAGQFTHNAPSMWSIAGWNIYSAQSYALLILERSVGGGCIDTDGDGACDSDDPCPNDPLDQCLIDCVEDLVARPKPGEVTLIWTHVGADSYNVYRDGAFLAETFSTYCTYIDTGLVNGVPHTYKVKPVLDGVEQCPNTGNEVTVTPVAGRRRR